VLSQDAVVITAERGSAAIEILREQPVDVVLSDLRMPDVDGLQVLAACRSLRPNAEFILMTAFASVPTAIEALRLGAYDYLQKPFEPDAVRAVVQRAIGRAATTILGDITTPAVATADEVLPGFFACSEQMHQLAERVRRVAQSDATALILGETGTGKERIARALHQLSSRNRNDFVPVNCAAIPADLLESELFGSAKGAYTGAQRDRAGLFEHADGGTLFLDEIGELRFSLQAKLTRALEERAIRRVGDVAERPIDVRLIAATHRDLKSMVAAQSFREDLWYRLNVATIEIPPLRERRDDIEPLARYFLREDVGAGVNRITGFSHEALAALRVYNWPGNVRQLRAAIESARIISTGPQITPLDLPREVAPTSNPVAATPSFGDLTSMTWQQASDFGRTQTARIYLTAVLEKYDNRIKDAAQHADVERESFYRLLRRFEVDSG